eukprot:TRINITY_DN7491_c0_g1_i1.p1 TRINITY_DN7491_c0_g1~~TRINITY_DN7491_c0_g1_i1.p1  ORF type:complete len:255 (-),score=51.98 TRINITY_DN7491_c0_g1_i1:84-848(-)
MLNPGRAVQVLAKWKTALAKLECDLKSVKEKDEKTQKETERFLEGFDLQEWKGVDSLQSKVEPKEKDQELSRFEFQLKFSPSSMGLVDQIQRVVMTNFNLQNLSPKLPPKSLSWELQTNCSIEEKVAKSTSGGGWAGTAEFTVDSDFQIELRINHTDNGWAQIAIADSSVLEFPSPGNTITNLPFCYNTMNGTVNDQGTFPRLSPATTSISLHFTKGDVRFSVNNVLQKGQWTMPGKVRILADIFPVNSEAILL